MQAIRTIKLAPTDTKGARIKATAAAGSVTRSYDHSLRHDLEANHRIAAEALVAKMGWNTDGYGTLVSGCLPDGSYCHVMTGRDGKGG
jgi:hypothetical protein